MTAAVKPKILVTRPQPGADKTAKRLSALGIQPLVLPFTEMVKLEHHLDGVAAQSADAVVVTSANALRFADKQMLDTLKPLPVYAVGDSTKEVALNSGLTNVVSANGDAQDLIKLVGEALQPNSTIIYLCGETRTDDIERDLTKLTIDVLVVETYRTNKVSQLTHKLERLIKSHNLDGILLYSSISAHILSEIWTERMSENTAMIPISFCISDRAKTALPLALKSGAVVCAKPRDDVMIDTVVRHFQSKSLEL